MERKEKKERKGGRETESAYGNSCFIIFIHYVFNLTLHGRISQQKVGFRTQKAICQRLQALSPQQTTQRWKGRFIAHPIVKSTT